jgi:hypothetical protein
MIEADPLTIAQFAHDTAGMALQAGPPSDLPGAVPDFVGGILDEIGASAGEATDGLGETISGLTPGGSETSESVGSAAGAAAENAPDQ